MTSVLLTIFVVTVMSMPACNQYPESYPPPIQRIPTQEYAFYRTLVAMSDADANAFLVRDIGGLENNSWRWTGFRPEMRFVLQRVENLKLVVNFSIAGVTFEQTGPVTISFFVNGRLLDKVRYDTHGEKQFSKDVDPSWLKINEDTIVGAEINPPWISPDKQTRLGIILVQAGFLQ